MGILSTVLHSRRWRIQVDFQVGTRISSCMIFRVGRSNLALNTDAGKRVLSLMIVLLRRIRVERSNFALHTDAGKRVLSLVLVLLRRI